MSKDRISHWVTKVIMHAYSNAVDELLDFVKCHSVHAVATSWAALCSVQLSEIRM